MLNDLFPFQKIAVKELRVKVAMALNGFRSYKVPQVISLQAPTGSGKTIIMASLIEDVYFGSDNFAEQPEAIFVWLSDSPQLNEQSKQKLDQKADRIGINQCIVIQDDSFDAEYLEDGHIYFLNTQKLGRTGNLGQHSDSRQYTIWETIENTAREKSDRLYFIIDEAHRGMQGRAAGTATTIMQKFIKGSAENELSPIPVVIGMSATAARFNALVGNTTSTLQKVIVSPAQVRSSGLLKDRIVITYPDDQSRHGDMSVLQAATDEWILKCQHWYQYTYEQHYTNVNPVFVIQVLAGTANRISDTDLNDVLAKIEERVGTNFSSGEVVHTFGALGTIQINGLDVPHIEPVEIVDNKKVKIVLFKENLSTGWDCPRAETMMSFRKAEDATYIAQLLGRMIRTPLQCHVIVDDSLNDVHLFLPYFNKDTVKNVIDELQNAEGGEIPTTIEGETMEEKQFVPWSVHPKKTRREQQIPGAMDLFNDTTKDEEGNNKLEQGVKRENRSTLNSDANISDRDKNADNNAAQDIQEENLAEQHQKLNDRKLPIGQVADRNNDEDKQIAPVQKIDRENIIRFINEQGFLTYQVKDVRINSYLKSLLSLAGLLTQNYIYPQANDEVKVEVTNLIESYVKQLRDNCTYAELARKVMEFKLSIQVFDVFGETIKDFSVNNLFLTSESDLDRQLRYADAKLGGYGFPFVYGRRFYDEKNPNSFKIDCILFAADDECIAKLNEYAKKKFHAYNDNYRKYVVSKSEKCRKQYSDIVADGDFVSEHNFTLPEIINGKVDKDGRIYTDHLFVDNNGEAQIKLNGWEECVLEEERTRTDFVCWLRNQVRKPWSLSIPYVMDGVTKTMYPDFVIVRKDKNITYVMDILEPHNSNFKDNLSKAKAFATYAKAEPRVGRVELIRMGKDAAGKDRLKRLDLAKGAIREKVLSATNNDEIDHIFDTDGEFKK